MAETNTSNIGFEKQIWDAACVLRGNIDASEYKSVVLGLIFLKYISDRFEAKYQELVAEGDGFEEDKDEYTAENIFFVPENARWSVISAAAHTPEIGTVIDEAMRSIEKENKRLKDILPKNFARPELDKRRLGEVVDLFTNIQMIDHGNSKDILGRTYEYCLAKFAEQEGKLAGEFYTPQPVAKLMTQIAFLGREDKQGFTLYDATMGSGSLLLNAKRYSRQPQTVVYFGQELNTSTYNLARMNMILHGVPIENQFLHNADTLDEDWPTQEPTNFDGVLMNPPYSAKWSASSGFMDDPRFSPFGKLAPKSKADFAFLLHGYYHLKQDNGVMAIVLPHGVLFRGNAEGTIRKALLEEGAIDTVIGLPANIFFNTSIPTTVIILKKNRTNRDVCFIDASKEFDKGKNQNIMTDAHIEKILNAYKSREDMDKFAHLASFEEIVENDYNLNIPRYVDTFEEEEVEPLTEIVAKINQTNATIESQTASLLDMLGQLHGTTPEADEELKAFVEAFKG